MGIDSTAYRVVLVLHVLCAIVGFGGVLLNGLYAAQASKRPPVAALGISEANYRVNMVAETFIYAVPLLGFVLVWLSDGVWSFGATWVWLSIVIYVAALAGSHLVLLPNHRTINGLLAEVAAAEAAGALHGPPPQAERIGALGKQQAAVGGVLHLALVVILVLMVWKPG